MLNTMMTETRLTGEVQIEQINTIEMLRRRGFKLPALAGDTIARELKLTALTHKGESMLLPWGDERIIKAQATLRPISAERILREYQILLRLAHPNIVPTEGLVSLTIGLDEYLGFLMPRLEVPQIDQIDKDMFLQLINDIARALAHAHSKGVYHRDFHPGNILHNPQENAFVLGDFSFGKITRTGSESGAIELIADTTHFIETFARLHGKRKQYFDPAQHRLFDLGVMQGLYPDGSNVRRLIGDYINHHLDAKWTGGVEGMRTKLLQAINSDDDRGV